MAGYQTKKLLLFELQRGKCAWCGRGCRLNNDDHPDQPPDLFTLDHVKPRDSGGTSHITNLQGLCRECNMKKANSYSETLKRAERAAAYAACRKDGDALDLAWSLSASLAVVLAHYVFL